MKIYTRTGDKGQTSLFGGERVSKNHSRVTAYGELDELNSALGYFSFLLEKQQKKFAEEINWVSQIQRQLFSIGSWLASREASANIIAGKPAFAGSRNAKTDVGSQAVTEIETKIDEWEKNLPPLKNFILPGGSEAGAFCHFSRSICRRAERSLIQARENGEEIPELSIIYINRLADALFVLARYVNWCEQVEEIPWS
ncbi:MAG: cob(I)yrinic acid a,c-diamide adenosyltransferase [Oligoflexia bacterium]|nr:cob(I)yrinic acid a,c-diamide adenosyltransferase [Oligoflexia bacterium]